MSPELMRRAARVRLFITDVDGVWTDGQVHFQDDGRESLSFHVRDGLGVQRLQARGVEVAAVSGRASTAFEKRAGQLGVRELRLSCADKGAAVEELRRARGLQREQIAVMGDDLPDLEMFSRAGLRIAPPNAAYQVLEMADYVTCVRAGYGALREACELLIAARLWAGDVPQEPPP